MTKFFYQGDLNAEHGGFLYSCDTWSAEVVRIQPCSDAGGPDNCYWIERLSVPLDVSKERRAQILESCGMDAANRSAFVWAAIAYGAYDQCSSELVQVGKPDPFYNGHEGEFNPSKVLRGNASILNYARKVAHQ